MDWKAGKNLKGVRCKGVESHCGCGKRCSGGGILHCIIWGHRKRGVSQGEVRPEECLVGVAGYRLGWRC
jgi:hypothetical protein